jgi:hypothetical protein
METASPFSKPIVMRSPCRARPRARWCADRRYSGASTAGSSSTLPSDEECSRLASTENGASPRLSLAIGIWCFSAKSSSLVRRGEVPFAPRRDHLDVGLQRIIAELEADLVVALAGGAVADGVGAGLRARSRSGAWRSAAGRSRCRADTALIERVGAEHREDEIAHEFLAHVLDEDVLLMPSISAFLRAGSSSSPWPRSAVKVTTSQP